MTFEKLLNDPLLHTPKSKVYTGNFYNYVDGVLDEFKEKVDDLDDHKTKIEGYRYRPAFVKEVVQILIEGIKSCLQAYLEGRINDAYQALDVTLSNKRKNFYTTLKQTQIETGNNFYRIRKNTENFIYSPKEMFHIPFELRGCVANQRYSINGFPSLYLGSNLYTCWEELKKPDLNNFQVIRFENNEEFTALDLTPPDLSDVFSGENYRYLLTWPIIFACSIRVKNPNDIFKPEYILPQLLLQWVRDHDKIDCIRYFSTNISKHDSKSTGNFSNYVFPVKKTKLKGYCPLLTGVFDRTEILSWQSYQMATGGQTFIYKSSEFASINAKIPNLEIIKNRPYPYSNSVLGRLEYYLDKMDTSPIEF